MKLYGIVDNAIGSIEGIGRLTVYDTALRIGAKLGFAQLGSTCTRVLALPGHWVSIGGPNSSRWGSCRRRCVASSLVRLRTVCAYSRIHSGRFRKTPSNAYQRVAADANGEPAWRG